ncbi:MAG: hypothetical protein Q9209_006710 [Squamulea sp. 1 TL-2023]
MLYMEVYIERNAYVFPVDSSTDPVIMALVDTFRSNTLAEVVSDSEGMQNVDDIAKGKNWRSPITQQGDDVLVVFRVWAHT